MSIGQDEKLNIALSLCLKALLRSSTGIGSGIGPDLVTQAANMILMSRQLQKCHKTCSNQLVTPLTPFFSVNIWATMLLAVIHIGQNETCITWGPCMTYLCKQIACAMQSWRRTAYRQVRLRNSQSLKCFSICEIGTRHSNRGYSCRSVCAVSYLIVQSAVTSCLCIASNYI